MTVGARGIYINGEPVQIAPNSLSFSEGVGEMVVHQTDPHSIHWSEIYEGERVWPAHLDPRRIHLVFVHDPAHETPMVFEEARLVEPHNIGIFSLLAVDGRRYDFDRAYMTITSDGVVVCRPSDRKGEAIDKLAQLAVMESYFDEMEQDAPVAGMGICSNNDERYEDDDPSGSGIMDAIRDCFDPSALSIGSPLGSDFSSTGLMAQVLRRWGGQRADERLLREIRELIDLPATISRDWINVEMDTLTNVLSVSIEIPAREVARIMAIALVDDPAQS